MDIPIDCMELGHFGNCRHNAVFCALAMRSLGLPVTFDFVQAWGNRSKGHEWNVMLLKDGGFLPFDPYGRDSVKFDYKPAKIFRFQYSSPLVLGMEIPDMEDVPFSLVAAGVHDVTDLYGLTYDIKVECTVSCPTSKGKKYGVICVFDNKEWKPVWYGSCRDKTMSFDKMMGDVVYLAAYYDAGKIYPASDPFILDKKGIIHYLRQTSEKQEVQDMTLTRKYPRFPRMEKFALSLRRSRVEGSNDPEFRNPTLLFDVFNTPVDISDSLVHVEKKFRCVRWKIVDYRTGDLAEVEFYGKHSVDAPEELLKGAIIGYSEADKEQDRHPYTAAMDGDPATYFSKPRNSLGYVGLDLGQGNEAYVTRVRFYPRSDTNFILVGNEYELFYWFGNGWRSAGRKYATDIFLQFDRVPSGTLYWLRNLTQGKEERPFTYENGQQVWW